MQTNGPKRAYPELITEDDWDIEYSPPGEYVGLTGVGERHMTIPAEDDAVGHFTRVHELGHAKYSPDTVDPTYKDKPISVQALQYAEDARVHTLLHDDPYLADILAHGTYDEANGAGALMTMVGTALGLGRHDIVAGYALACTHAGDQAELDALLAKWKGAEGRKVRRTVKAARRIIARRPRSHLSAQKAAARLRRLPGGDQEEFDPQGQGAGDGPGGGGAEAGEGQGEGRGEGRDGPSGIGNGGDGMAKSKPDFATEEVKREIDDAIVRAKKAKRSASARKGAATRRANKARKLGLVTKPLPTTGRRDATGRIDHRMADEEVTKGLLDREYGVAKNHGYRNGFDDGIPQWGEMTIWRPRLSVAVKAELPRPNGSGLVPRHISRLHTNGRVFSRKKELDRARPGAILIDASGSMCLSDADIMAVLKVSPFATIALYCGGYSTGILVILAKNGRRVAAIDEAREECMAEADRRGVKCAWGGNNTVDGPALEWLGEQIGPRYWISDGCVVGVGRGSMSRAIIEDAAYLAARAKVTRYETISNSLRGLGLDR